MKNIPSGFKKTALVSALMLANGSQAATIDVDGVTCNLNDAVVSANTDTATGGCIAGAGSDVLELPANATINLTDTLSIESEVTLNANGSTIQPDAGGAPFRLVGVNYAGDLSLNDAVLSGGYDQNYNRAGGAYVIQGNMDINRSTVTGNTGGGVGFIIGATGSIEDSNILNNVGKPDESYYGAGILINSSTVSISGSTISGNTSSSSVEGGAGIQVSTYFANYGYSTLVDLTNTTISANNSDTRGAGVFTYTRGGYDPAVINMTNVTVAANSSSAGVGGGLSSDGATITLAQSLFSGNNAVSGGVEIDVSAGAVIIDDYNLFGLDSVSGVGGVTIGVTDIVPAEATLAEIIDVALADNGGPTLTHALVDGSPAIDAIPAASCASPSDQTGLVRPQDGDGDMTADCDIGAYEVEGVDLDLIFEDGFEG